MLSIIWENAGSREDAEYVQKLYDKHKEMWLSMIQEYAELVAESEDILQECAVKLLNCMDTLRSVPKYAETSYVMELMRNIIFDRLRRLNLEKKYFNHTNETESKEDVEDSEMSMEEMVVLRDNVRMLRSALDRMSATERFLLIGKYMMYMSDEQLAEKIGCQPSSIRMKLTRARNRARKILEEMNYNHE